MKKTLVALAVAAFATSASALTVYENEGTKVEMYGKVAVALDKNSSKEDGETKKRAHSNLHDDGTRFGVKVDHNIAEDFYALGRLEFRFNGNAKKTDGFGDLYAKRAYVGLGSKQYGELTFGRQVTIGDDIAQAGFDNAYTAFKTTLTTDGASVVRYDYKGVEGLQVGVSYRFAEERVSEDDATPTMLEGEVVKGKVKSGYDVGAKYTFAPAENQSVTLAAGYSRNNFKVEGSKKHHKDAYAFGAKYTVDALTLAADYAGSFDKKVDGKTRINGFRVGAKYQVTPAVAVYGNYGRAVHKDTDAANDSVKTTYNRFMLGTSYQLHKNVFTYVEGGVTRAKASGEKSTDKGVTAGLSVSW